jgi:hypothetical protein
MLNYNNPPIKQCTFLTSELQTSSSLSILLTWNAEQPNYSVAALRKKAVKGRTVFQTFYPNSIVRLIVKLKIKFLTLERYLNASLENIGYIIYFTVRTTFSVWKCLLPQDCSRQPN